MRTVAVLVGPALLLAGLTAGCSGGAQQTEITNPANESTHQCAGEGVGGIEIAQGSSYDLPEGVRAALASTDMDGSPPTATIDLANVDDAERDAATRMRVGDTFGAAGVSYRVERICQHVVEVQEQ